MWKRKEYIYYIYIFNINLRFQNIIRIRKVLKQYQFTEISIIVSYTERYKKMNKYNVRFHENGSLGLTLVASPTGYTVVQKPGKGQATNKGIDPGDVLLRVNGNELGEMDFDDVLQNLKQVGRPVDMEFATLVNAETRMKYFGQEEPLYFGGLGQHGENTSVLEKKLSGRSSVNGVFNALMGGAKKAMNTRSGGGGNKRRTSITSSNNTASRGNHVATKGRPGPPPRRPPRPGNNNNNNNGKPPAPARRGGAPPPPSREGRKPPPRAPPRRGGNDSSSSSSSRTAPPAPGRKPPPRAPPRSNGNDNRSRSGPPPKKMPHHLHAARVEWHHHPKELHLRLHHHDQKRHLHHRDQKRHHRHLEMAAVVITAATTGAAEVELHRQNQDHVQGIHRHHHRQHVPLQHHRNARVGQNQVNIQHQLKKLHQSNYQKKIWHDENYWRKRRESVKRKRGKYIKSV